LRQQAVAGHGQKHARLAQHHHQQHRGDAGERADIDDPLRVGKSSLLEGIGHRRVDVDLIIGHHAGEHQRHGDVQHGADDQRGDDADGHVAIGTAGLFRVGGNRVKSDVGEKDNGRTGENAQRFTARSALSQDGMAEETQAGIPIRGERFEILRIKIKRPDRYDKQNDRQFNDDHARVEISALANAFNQNDGDDGGYGHRDEIQMGAGGEKLPRRRIKIKRRRGPLMW